MLGMYHLTNDKLYLDKAVSTVTQSIGYMRKLSLTLLCVLTQIDIGDRLLPALTKSPSPVPYSDVNLKTGQVHAPKWGPDSSVSEVTTIQLEFRDLTFITGNQKYKVCNFSTS